MNEWIDTILSDAVLDLVGHLLIGFVLSLLLCFQFRWFKQGQSQLRDFNQVIPLMVLSTVLIISIIKSSLALSLGLVGALSIVRFRTPIKEPEELVYIFLAIAVGIGLGAQEAEMTVVGFVLILGMMSIYQWQKRSWKDSTQVILTLSDSTTTSPEVLQQWLTPAKAALLKLASDVQVSRLDVMDHGAEVVISGRFKSIDSVLAAMADIQKLRPGLSFTYLEQRQLPVF